MEAFDASCTNKGWCHSKPKNFHGGTKRKTNANSSCAVVCTGPRAKGVGINLPSHLFKAPFYTVCSIFANLCIHAIRKERFLLLLNDQFGGFSLLLQPSISIKQHLLSSTLKILHRHKTLYKKSHIHRPWPLLCTPFPLTQEGFSTEVANTINTHRLFTVHLKNLERYPKCDSLIQSLVCTLLPPRHVPALTDPPQQLHVHCSM